MVTDGDSLISFVAKRLAVALGLYALFYCSYIPANLHIPLSRCHDLSTGLDAAIPFIPEFMYPYYLHFPAMMFPAFFIKDAGELKRAVLAFGVLIIFSVAVFFIFPVQVPRPTSIPDTFAGQLVAFMYDHDRPVCGFPSLHVSASLLSALVVFRHNRAIGRLLFVMFSLTSVTVLFVKQHVLADALGGIAAACLVYWLFIRRKDCAVEQTELSE